MVAIRIPTLVFVAILLVILMSACTATALPSSSSSRSSSSSSSSASRNRSSSSSSSSSSANSASSIAARNRAQERNRQAASSSSSSSFRKNRSSWAHCPATGNTRPIGVGSSTSPVSDGNGSKGWYEYDSCRHTCWFVQGESNKDGSITTTMTTRYTTACPSGSFSLDEDSGDNAEDEETSSAVSTVSTGWIRVGSLVAVVVAMGGMF